MEIVFAGRGPVGERCLQVLHDLGVFPSLYDEWENKPDMKANGLSVEYKETPDLLISVHWPDKYHHFDGTGKLYGFKLGGLNLHNSYLPWNRGAHACSWAILDGTPHGASLHWIDSGLDTGDIFYQEQLTILPTDTADSLYQRTADLEVEVFKHGMKFFLEGDRTRIPQTGRGSFHRKKDLELMKRALTTNDLKVVNV